MKKLIVLWVALALIAFSIAPAFADRGSGGNSGGDRSGQQSGPGSGEQERAQDRAGDPEQERNQDGDDDPEQEREREQEEERNRDGDDDSLQQRAREREQRFELAGRIVAIDRATGAITIAVTGAVRPADRALNRVKVQTAAETLLQRRAGSRWVPATLGDYRVGQAITARGTMDAGSWTAARIRVGAQP